ncbi:hypothetical protein [Nocardioides sp.]|uniref:hypothetical protein n=1 Tax=Nocardioides sp. TaxID=35761 RepID=UPI003514FFFB
MPQVFTRAAIAGVAAVATLAAGGLAPVEAAPAAKPAPRAAAPANSLTPFGLNATVFGTKVVVGGVEVRSLKDALINRPCTRRTGLETENQSLLSTEVLPDALRDIVDFSLSTSKTQTYKDAARQRTGIRASNTLASLSLGGEVLGVQTPRVVLEGLTSVVDSFYNAKTKKFGQTNSFGFGDLRLELSSEDQISQTVDSLLELLGISDATDAIGEVVDVPINALLEIIGSVPLELPGLGSISIGKSTGRTWKNGAVAEAYALKIQLDEIPQLGVPTTILQLGRANSIISRPVPAGVFRSKMSALEANIGGVLRLGGVGQRSLPCEGTSGKVVTSKVASAGVPNVLSLSGIEYAYKGVQQGKKATGFVQTTIGKIDLKVADVVIEGLVSRVNLSSSRPGARVTSEALTKVGRVLINGNPIDLLPGQTQEFTDASGQKGFIRRAVLTGGGDGFFGKNLTGIQIDLPGALSTVDLGVANGQVFFR